MPYALDAYYLLAPAECSANLARFDGVRYGLRLPGDTVEQMMAASRRDGFGPEVTRRILLGTYALSAGYYEAFYGRAQKVRTLVIADFARAFQEVDVLVTPHQPDHRLPHRRAHRGPPGDVPGRRGDHPLQPGGLPGVSVPVGLDERGLPIGFQVLAAPLGEAVLLRAARAVEALTGFSARPALATSEAR